MTVYSEGVWRKQVTATKPNPGTEAKQIVMVPEGVTDLTLYVRGSAAATARVEESPSSGEAIQTGTPAPDWLSVDASLDSVGTTLVRYVLGDRTPVALRVSSLVDNQSATLIVVGRKIGR
jgi:hypothetical protein